MYLQRFCVLSALLCCTAMSVHAAQVFSNYQGGNPGGSAFGVGQAMAVQFTPGANAWLTDVQVYIMSGGEGFSSTLSASLMSDSAGVPGVVLESLGSLPSQSSWTPNLVQQAASGSTLLSAGTPYWLALAFVSGDVAGGWQSGGSPTVLTAFSNGGGLNGPWNVPSPNSFQFIINGSETPSQVPEPGTAALAATALGALAAYRRIRRG